MAKKIVLLALSDLTVLSAYIVVILTWFTFLSISVISRKTSAVVSSLGIIAVSLAPHLWVFFVHSSMSTRTDYN